MSIKCDRWIRDMAREHRMIEPFEPHQVRRSDGVGVISYGTSSYGYDVRCAPAVQGVHEYFLRHRGPERRSTNAVSWT